MTRSKSQLILFCIVVCIFASQPARAGYPISLDGYWRFELDPADAGVQQQWFGRALRGYIKLPGIIQAQYFGNDITT